MPAAKKNQGIKKTLLMGVFWRIVIIEIILLIWSLGYRFYQQSGQSEMLWWDLFWYAVRILIMVAIIVAFMVITLRTFLAKKVITPLETIAETNRQLQNGMEEAHRLEAPEEWPREIKEIVATRSQMLDTIYEVSEERLKLLKFIRETFGRYLSGEVVEEILNSPQGRSLGGRRREVTVLMSDLRGFTRMSDRRDPEDVVNLLNRYFAVMAEIISRHGGFIEDILGDGLMAVFGALKEREAHPARAVACGLAMQIAILDLNQEITSEGHAPLQMGIGINTGTVVVGNIGSEKRMKYAMVGSPVNLTSRIESNAVGGQVLISQQTHDALKSMVAVEPPFEILGKGMSEPLKVYPVISIGEPYSLTIPDEPSKLSGEVQIPFVLWPLEEKQISNRSIKGTTLAAGGHLILARLEENLPKLTDVKLLMEPSCQDHRFEDIYAKVIAVKDSPQGTVHHLQITAIGSADWHALRGSCSIAPSD